MVYHSIRSVVNNYTECCYSEELFLGQDSVNDYNDIWVLDFGVDTNASLPSWSKLRVGGTLPEVRYGGHGGVYPFSGLSFWLGFGFNKKEETGKRLGDSFRITFTNTSTVFDAYE